MADKPLRGVPPEQRFWAYVDKSGDCWLWTGAHTSRGYGVITIDYRSVYTHRYALVLAGRPAEPHQLVCHHCDTPLCVRPEHLFVGSAADNATDMVRKGRSDRRPKSPEHRRKIGESGRAYRALHPEENRERLKTHCPQGHPYTPENTYRYNGHRWCRTCVLARNRAADHRRRRERVIR